MVLADLVNSFHHGYELAIYEFNGFRPVIGEGTWIAPNADVIGNVTIGEHSYIGFGAIIRGDFAPIAIGDRTAIEENVVIHGAHGVSIGNKVIVGHKVMLHDTTLHDCCLIGMMSMICDFSEIGEWSIIAEQSMVKKRQKIPPYEIFGGVPASKIGVTTQRHQDGLSLGQQVYGELSTQYTNGLKKIG